MHHPPRWILSGVSLASLALALWGLTALGASQALASHVACGDVITQKTTLDSDLDCLGLSEPALVVGASGVKLDLAGHSILTTNVGVLNEGHDNVRIEDGGVTAPCGTPILLRGADRNRLKDLSAGGGCGGVLLEDSDENRLVGNQFGADTGGLVLRAGSDQNTIVRNALGGGLGGGLAIFESDENIISRNAFTDGGEFASALAIRAGSDNTHVSRNDLLGNGLRDGLAVDAQATGTFLVRNEVRGYLGDGIQVDSPSTTLTRNRSDENGGWGILAVPGVIDGGGNTALGNAAGQCLNVSC